MKNSSINILIADDDKDDVSMLAEALQNILPSEDRINTTAANKIYNPWR